MNRRKFVSSIAVAGAAVAAGSRLFASDSKPRLRVGVIGSGWYGGVNLAIFQRNLPIHVVSLCDPNTNKLANLVKQSAGTQPEVPATFADYREMLAHAPLDVVIVTTPDHWHALPAIAAIQAGADLYLEKPIGHDVIEGEALVAAARKYKRVVQVNTQRRSNPLYAEAREKFITSGRLGTVGLAEAFSYLPGRPTGVIPEAAVPAHLNYDLWTGPAPMIPYREQYEVRGWRSWMEFGNGQIGDLGVHMLDKVRWILGLGWPSSVQSSGGILTDKPPFSANISDTQRSVFQFPGLEVSWEHRTWGVSPIPPRHWSDQWGARLIGTGGTLNMTMLECVFTPAGGGAREGRHMLSSSGNLENIDFNRPGNAYAEVENNHLKDFLKARETRGRPIADIEQGHISSAMCSLANLSLELGRPVAYDPKTRTVPGDAKATAGLARAYRAPWVHPTPENI
ncbi:MAG TPA: Gfo/Idh/MocA family oxidoreductase [Opitutaceae bacterium]|nr:Gfo/Idh/MocA family oxidoreductase [Opitutaceae bacterium]